ncbi:MAG: hypothetical protein WBI17_09700 [Clostridiaceae bacterium]
MGWLTTTRWIDTKCNNIEEAVDLIMLDNETLNKEGAIVYKNLIKEKAFAHTMVSDFNNQSILYNLIQFKIDSVTPGDGVEEFRTTTINGLILVYKVEGSVTYLINRNYDALKLLRILCNYDGRGEILEDKTNMSSDMFMWFVKSVYNKETSFTFTQEDQTEKDLLIESILGVRSETRDENRLSAQGNTVMNLISTLSFILESDKINQLIIRIEYSTHKVVEIKLTNGGVISCDIDSYSGDYESLNLNDLTCKLLLLVYLEIVPNLKQVYYNDIDSADWGKDKKEEFFLNVKSELVSRLEERSKSLQ